MSMEKVATYTLYADSVRSLCTQLVNLQIELKCAGVTNGEIKFKLYILSSHEENLPDIKSEEDITQRVHHIVNASVRSGQEAFQWGTSAKFITNAKFVLLCVFADVNCSVIITHKVKYVPHCLIIMPNSTRD